MKRMTFVMAMKDYFGNLPGKTAMDFAKEIRALTNDDRTFFTAELATVGYEITT